MALMTWVPAYSIRRRGGFDYDLGTAGQAVRWCIVLGSAAGMRYGPIPWVRVTCGVLFLAFIAWPNLAWYPMAALAWVRRVPRPPREPRWQREGAVDQQPDNPPRKAKDPTKPLGL